MEPLLTVALGWQGEGHVLGFSVEGVGGERTLLEGFDAGESFRCVQVWVLAEEYASKGAEVTQEGLVRCAGRRGCGLWPKEVGAPGHLILDTCHDPDRVRATALNPVLCSVPHE